MSNTIRAAILGSATLFTLTAAVAQTTIQVDAAKAGAPISPTMFGIFFEDINFGGDGGLYPELVKNRSFEFDQPLMGWKTTGIQTAAKVMDVAPLNSSNPHYLRVTAGFGVTLNNEGFAGMGIRDKASYTISAYIRSAGGNKASVDFELISASGQSLGKGTLSSSSSDWQKITSTLVATGTYPKASLKLSFQGNGDIDVDMISVYPQETWNNRPNGLRKDLVQLLKDLKPGFMRFPGGCIVEGYTLDKRYQWKTTIGDLSERKLIVNRWNSEFKHRPTPDYYQSFGLGFFEYFQLCEDIGAQPLPILNCGMACQFNSGELAPLNQLDPFIQDALDLIEFANGPETSKWGKRRAELGHPAPFNMKLLGVGNEQWGPQYVERYAVFAKALKSKHPEIKLISSAGPAPGDDKNKFLWQELKKLNADIIDEHCYDKPAWFFNSATRYDKFDRNGPKIFMGEYAAQSVSTCSPENRNNWECALSEAAFMTGLERNADLVVLSSYAPLSGHVDRWQWRPNLIWFDNLRSFGTPNYYAQKMFSANLGTHVLPIKIETKSKAYGSASLDKNSGEIILKLVNAGPAAPSTIRLAGVDLSSKTIKCSVLASDDLKAENSLDQPLKVAPVDSIRTVAGPEFSYTLAPNSVTVLRIPSAVK